MECNVVTRRRTAALAPANDQGESIAYLMAVYSHYRYRSYIRETLARGKIPWSYLDDDDVWLKQELKSKALEIGYWT